MIGGNFRLHELQAAFLRVKLRHLDQALEKRHQNAKKLIQLFQERWKAVFPVHQCLCEGEKTVPSRHPDGAILLPFSCQKGEKEHTWNQFVIRIIGQEQRENLRHQLQVKGIQSEIYYPRGLHEQPCFGRPTPRYFLAERLKNEVLAVPLVMNL
ncbi:MAG: hypothetical protein EBX50_15340 [Chitinophagia bacterium]|nr:hypothetical protein [Chitinophagia bacterium]